MVNAVGNYRCREGGSYPAEAATYAGDAPRAAWTAAGAGVHPAGAATYARDAAPAARTAAGAVIHPAGAATPVGDAASAAGPIAVGRGKMGSRRDGHRWAN